MAIIPRNSLSETDQKAIREQLDRLLRSRLFQKSKRRRQFLEYIVNEELAGRSHRLTGYNLALDVFGRPDTFDPVVDPVVRVEAARLRDKLREYYAGDGRHDPIRIELPKGTYTPQIDFRHEDRIAHQETPPPQEVSSTVPAIAVLSFDDLSAHQNLGYLGDGVAEDIITALCRFPDLRVVARGSSFAYKGKAVDLRQVGEELGVGYILEGSVRSDGEKLRIVAQLIDTKSGEHIWAERFNRSGADPWALQDQVTGMIVSALTGEKGALMEAQHRQAWGKGTTLEEYDYYLRGHDQLMKYTKAGIERSGDIWREGLAKFPNSPLLKVKLGWHHMVRAYAFVSDDPTGDARNAGQLARQVLANEHLSPQVARLAIWLMSYVLVQERDFDGAFAAVNKTVALAPYDMFVVSRLIMVLVQVGRPHQALEWADQVATRDPSLSWSYSYGKGWAYLLLERFGEAIEALSQTEFNDAPLLLAVAYLRIGRLADARAEVIKMLKINPAITLSAWRLGYSFRDATTLDRFAPDLAQSGLPEK